MVEGTYWAPCSPTATVIVFEEAGERRWVKVRKRRRWGYMMLCGGGSVPDCWKVRGLSSILMKDGEILEDRGLDTARGCS